MRLNVSTPPSIQASVGVDVEPARRETKDERCGRVEKGEGDSE